MAAHHTRSHHSPTVLVATELPSLAGAISPTPAIALSASPIAATLLIMPARPIAAAPLISPFTTVPMALLVMPAAVTRTHLGHGVQATSCQSNRYGACER